MHRKGITEQQFTSDAQLTEGQYRELERGRIEPGILTLDRIALALGVTLAELFRDL